MPNSHYTFLQSRHTGPLNWNIAASTFKGKVSDIPGLKQADIPGVTLIMCREGNVIDRKFCFEGESRDPQGNPNGWLFKEDTRSGYGPVYIHLVAE